MEEIKKGEIVIFRAERGLELQVQMKGDTVWLSQLEMATLFQKDVRTINEHVKNIYKEAELSQNQTIRKFRIVQSEGSKQVERLVNFYNLDVVISVGYRVKSRRGTEFRIWATNRLRDYLVKGYAINEKRLKEEHDVKMKELEKTAGLFQSVLESKRADGYEKDLLKIITDYAHTWALLNKYDKGELSIEGVTKKTPKNLEHADLKDTIEIFKQRLVVKKEAGSLFGQEVGDKFKAVLGNINQTYGGKLLYPTVEERAAHLLYFLVKDHPFSDGNKRIGALIFMVYLVQCNSLYSVKTGERKINDNALAALTLLVAESHPKSKDVMVKLIVNLINGK